MEARSNLSHPISLRPAWILSSHLHVGQPSCVFSSGFLTKDLCVILSSSMHTIRPASQERVFWNLFYDFKGLINSRNFFVMSLGPFCQHNNSQSRKADYHVDCSTSYKKYTPCTITHTEHSILISIIKVRTAVAQWLRCCATNRKVAGSIPVRVSGIFHWHKILPIALRTWGRLSL